MAPRPGARKALRPEMTVRQVAADLPGAEGVFRAHGEQDAPPARFGHLEPLTNFARRRGIALRPLLAELAAATGAPIEWDGRSCERVHHAFLLSALALTLTFGAGWGAWLLWQIGRQGGFQGAPAAHVIAHGEAQLWGFIALFVMGVAFRTVLRDAIRGRRGVWVCRGLLTLTLAGVAGSLLWSLFPDRFASLGVASALMFGLMAGGLWSLQIALLRTKWRTTWARAVLCSGGWLCAWALLTVWLRAGAGAGGPGSYSDAQRMLLITLAVFGFAMNAIYGFGQMLLPGLLRVGSTRDWAVELGHWLHNAGTVIACLATGVAASGQVMALASGLLVGGAVMFGVGHRGFVGRRRTTHRAEQGHAPLDLYPPLAFGWLIVALLLLIGGSVYASRTASPLPQAYLGAVRHALTVGFMTTLVLGVGQRMIPVLDHTVLAMPQLTVPILALIGSGNLVRVSSELATLVTPAAYGIMPISAVMEWLALLLFTLCMSATMWHRDPLLRRGRVTKRSSLAVLLAEHPWIEERLRPTGTRYLQRARSVPAELTIGSYATSEGFDATELVTRLNTWLREGRPTCCVEAAATAPPQPPALQRGRP